MTVRPSVGRGDGAGRVALVLGGLTWIPARWGVHSTWDTTELGLGYVGWNRLVLVPLTLLVVGCVRRARAATGRSVRAGWWVVASGFAAAWVGVALEFVVGGGLRGGPPALAMAGWTAYVLGSLVAGLGAAVLAVAVGRDRGRPRAVGAAGALALAAVAMLAWPVVMILGSPVAGLVDQVVVGIAWALVGMAAASRR